MAGVAQKGPFEAGATVTLQELDNLLNPTGQTFTVATTDNSGSFAIPPAVSSNLIEVIINGFFFDEVWANAQPTAATLHAYADLQAAQGTATVNVNLITQLQNTRLQTLLTGGASYAAAEQQSGQEVLAAFHIPPQFAADFTQASLTGGTDESAILLAVSVVMLNAGYQGSASTAEANALQFINQFTLTMQTGAPSAPVEAAIAAVEATFTCSQMNDAIQRLTAYYSSFGISFPAPPAMDFIDTGWMGSINRLRDAGVDCCPVADAGSDCGGSCTDLKIDPSNCGTCGIVCASAEACIGSSCACPSALDPTFCPLSGTCVNTTSDPNNCGTCGNICGGGAGCQVGVCEQTGWPKWHHDNFNTGQSSADTSGNVGNLVWKYAVGAPSAGITYINSPAIDDLGNVYQMDMAGVLHAINGAGAQVWQVAMSSPSGDPQPSTPAILDDGSIFVATGSKGSSPFLYYVSQAGAVTYSLPGSAPFQAGFDSCPALSQDGTLFLADLHSGSSACGGAGGGDPDSAIAFTANAGNVTQVGGLALPLTNESGPFGVVVAADDTSYWGNNGQFFAVTPPAAGFTLVPAWPACGVTLANQSLSAVSNLALDTVSTGSLYAYSAWETSGLDGGYTVQGNIAALNPSTGAQQWTFNMPPANLPSGWTALQSDVGNAAPAIAFDGTVYVGNGDGLYAIDGALGTKKWLFSSADVTSSPAIGGDGTIFFGCDDGNFYAVNPDGTMRFKITTGGSISSSPAIGPDGTVFFVSDDGYLYAVR